MEWYLKALRQFSDFSGRARRKEYWMFVLINAVVGAGLLTVDNALGINFVDPSPIGLLYTVYALAAFVPSLAVAVRRMHDIGRSGWSLLVAVIPLIGGIVVLVWLAKEGTPQDNAYGPDPKAEPELALA